MKSSVKTIPSNMYLLRLPLWWPEIFFKKTFILLRQSVPLASIGKCKEQKAPERR